MSVLKLRRLVVNYDKSTKPAVVKQITEMLETMMPGTIIITMEIVDDLENLKKRYFAMVTELGTYAGYSSPKDRKLFKEQVRTELDIESIAEIKDCDEMRGVIEELHKRAATHYEYTFKDGSESTESPEKPFKIRRF